MSDGSQTYLSIGFDSEGATTLAIIGPNPILVFTFSFTAESLIRGRWELSLALSNVLAYDLDLVLGEIVIATAASHPVSRGP